MSFNLPGTLVPFHLIINPRLILPSLIVKDIRQLDFGELRRAGYRGAVFDKDNCLTLPHKDQLVPELKDAWRECRNAFGEKNILIVSNSAGTRLDPGLIQVESVTYHLSASVLRHKSFKPSYSCISAVRSYFATLPEPIRDEELIVVGDRIFTDVVLANRMARVLPPAQSADAASEKAAASSGTESSTSAFTDVPESRPQTTPRVKTRNGPLSVWTTGVWEKENMLMRALERGFMQGIQKYVVHDNGVRHLGELEHFVKKEPALVVPEMKPSLTRRVWEAVRRTRGGGRME